MNTIILEITTRGYWAIAAAVALSIAIMWLYYLQDMSKKGVPKMDNPLPPPGAGSRDRIVNYEFRSNATEVLKQFEQLHYAIRSVQKAIGEVKPLNLEILTDGNPPMKATTQMDTKQRARKMKYFKLISGILSGKLPNTVGMFFTAAEAQEIKTLITLLVSEYRTAVFEHGIGGIDQFNAPAHLKHVDQYHVDGMEDYYLTQIENRIACSDTHS